MRLFLSRDLPLWKLQRLPVRVSFLFHLLNFLELLHELTRKFIHCCLSNLTNSPANLDKYTNILSEVTSKWHHTWAGENNKQASVWRDLEIKSLIPLLRHSESAMPVLAYKHSWHSLHDQLYNGWTKLE